MSCELKNKLVKEFTKQFNQEEGDRLGEAAYLHVYTPTFKKHFGDFTNPAVAKGRTDMKDGLPTAESVMEYFAKKGIKAEKDLPVTYMKLIDKYTPTSPTSVRENLIQQTEALLKRVVKEVGDYAQTKTLLLTYFLIHTMESQKKQKALFKTKIEGLLTKLQTYKTEEALVEYVREVNANIESIEKALKLRSKDVNVHYEYLKRLRYFAAIEDVVYIINKNPKLKAKFDSSKINYSKIADRIQTLKQKLSERFIDVLGEKWGQVEGKQTRIAKDNYARSFGEYSAWKRNNPEKKTNEFLQARAEHVDKMVELNKEELQQAEKDFNLGFLFII